MVSSPSNQASNFQLIINNALDEYKRRTKKDLLAHPFVTELQSCNTPSAILSILQRQVHESRRNDDRWTRWLDPTVNVLFTLSAILGEGVSLVFSPAKVIFAGFGVLLSAVNDVRTSQNTLIDTFEQMGMFFRRLEVYTQLSPTTEMTDIIIRIMAEVLSILGIATNEMKEGRLKKYAKKLIGSTKMGDALKRLDKLTQEEDRMASAQNLRITHTVDERVRGVVDTVDAIDKRVGVVGDRVASVNDRVVTVDNRVKTVDNKVTQVIADGKERARDVDQLKRNQLRENIHRWLSPPDSSTNQNIARATHHKKTASWFFQGRIYQDWKSTGSLLWIHGKPGSGKSIICSTVIEDIEAMCNAGHASMAYFYFDFRDANKQGLRSLVTSLLIQLSVSSGPRCNILSDLYSVHDEGQKQASDDILTECLKTMLKLPHQCPTYLIIDALDESPNTSGIPSPRERVLHLLEELVALSLPNVHICVTSRPEFDIRNILEPLTSSRVSLHDQSGQKKDIAEYVRSIVYSDSEQIMRRWRKEDKELVIKRLSEQADGMFRWVFCQLQSLRHCFPPSVRHTLDELPESLDETYERVLKDINKQSRCLAHRLLQCLVVAIRPLRIDELAEVLAVDFDDVEGIPRLKPDWRWEDHEQALLTSCSSLIAIVKIGNSRIVQFSHFSVKEFLTSARLASSSGDLLQYYIDLEPAHTILAQACLSVLLQLVDRVEDDVGKTSPLDKYSAQYWVIHAQFKEVSSCLRKAMGYLFDPDKPYFSAWLQLHDVDTRPESDGPLYLFTPNSQYGASPVYYAALCGFQDVVGDLVVKYPQDVNTRSGWYVTPLVAALMGGHFRTAKHLYDNGAHLTFPGGQRTPLHSAAWYGDVNLVQVLLDYKADINARSDESWTPLHDASEGYEDLPGLADVVRLLLDHGTDVNVLDKDNVTPLHVAARNRRIGVIPVLLEHGANVGAEDRRGRTPLHTAAENGTIDVVRVLLEHGANVGAEDKAGRTPLHAAAGGRFGMMEVLRAEVVSLLLEYGANVGAKDAKGITPFQIASAKGNDKIAKLLSDYAAM